MRFTPPVCNSKNKIPIVPNHLDICGTMSENPTPVDDESDNMASATTKATQHTVQKVMTSVGKLLSKNEHIHRHSITLANKAHDLVEKHAPSVLPYLPEKRVSKEFIFLVVASILLKLL